MKLDWKEVVKPTAVLFVICAVVSAALAGTNLVTKDRIAQQAEETAQQSRQIVLPEAEEFSEQEGYYTGSAGGETVGYVFETEAKGYGGTVSVMTGISAEGSVTGVVILSHEETPGLGANAEKAEVLQQYQQPAPEGGLSVVKYQTPQEGQVEAITGATITTAAVTDAVNEAIEQYYAVKGGA